MATNKVAFEVRPHTTSRRSLLQQRDIYRQGRTPTVDQRGRIQALDIAPAGPERAARHLDKISTRFGPRGLGHTIQGLDITRGRSYTDEVLRLTPVPVRSQIPAQALVGANVGQSEERMLVGGVGPRVAEAVDRSRPSGGLDRAVSDRLPSDQQHRFDRVRIHDDSAAHAAADLLHARAFTIGQSVYLGRGESRSNVELLTHELAHTAQQGDPTPPAAIDDLNVSNPSSAAEVEAHQFATAMRDSAPLPALRPRPAGAARIMRQISFSHANDVVNSVDPGVNDTAATFQFGAGAPAGPYFQWTTDVTISGHAGDPFGDFQVGPHQVVRAFWFNVWWGTGTNRTHMTSSVTTPIRDATAAGNTWYHDAFASANFAASGDVRSTRLEDTPGIQNIPLANPVPPRTSTRGWFNWGMSFVAYVSARDTTAVTGAAAFRAIAHTYWNLSIAGTFDTTQPVGSQVTVTGGGRTNTGRVLEGGSADFPSMHGGAIFNDASNAAVTTT